MNNDFNFIGKTEHYNVPDDFFGGITQRTLQQAKRRSKLTLLRRVTAICASSAAAAVLLFAVIQFVQPSVGESVTIDSIVAQIDDSDVQELLIAMDTDAFYSDYNYAEE